MSTCSSDLQLLAALFTKVQFFLLDWSYSIPGQLSHSSNISKTWGTKNNFNIIASSFNVQDTQMIISDPPKRLGLFSRSFLFITLCCNWLQSTAPSILAYQPMALACLVCCGLLLQRGLIHNHKLWCPGTYSEIYLDLRDLQGSVSWMLG